MERRFLSISSSGVILSASGNAPAGLVGDQVATAPLDESVRKAATDLIEEHRRKGGNPGPVTISATAGGDVQIALCEAVPVERRPCDVARYIENVLQPLRPQAAGFDIKLSHDSVSQIPPLLLIDPEKIAWVVISIVGNAFRFVRHGSRNLPGGFVRVETGYDAAKETLQIRISDDGPGIPPERIPWIFRRKPGSEQVYGLSLQVAHEILAAHGGSIEAQSLTGEDRHGTVFLIELPAPVALG